MDLLQANGQGVNKWETPEDMSSLPVRLTTRHIHILNRTFTEVEVRNVVFQMGGLKAPGPDGVPAIFLQKVWEMVGGDVVRL